MVLSINIINSRTLSRGMLTMHIFSSSFITCLLIYSCNYRLVYVFNFFMLSLKFFSFSLRVRFNPFNCVCNQFINLSYFFCSKFVFKLLILKSIFNVVCIIFKRISSFYFFLNNLILSFHFFSLL